MKPASSRAARRRAQKSNTPGAITVADIAARVAKAKVKGAGKPQEDRAKRILTSFLQTAQTYGMPVSEVVAEMASGKAALRLGHAVRDEIMKAPPEAVTNAACTQGCAFCCILSGGEGGVITAFEAAQLHQAASPLAGQPDGRAWHPEACPALDPETRSCRAYEARPMICRSFLSTDALACESNAAGGTEKGAGLLGSHLDYLVIHALCRQALKGITQVHSYSMAATAASAVAGDDTETGLAKARHKPSALDTACRDAVRAAQA